VTVKAKAEGSVSFSESFHWHDFRHTCFHT